MRSIDFAKVAVAAVLLVFAVSPKVLADEAPPTEPEAASAAASGTPWPIPAAGSCQPEAGLIGALGGPPDDATAAPFETGDVFSLEQIEALRAFVPEFVWENRERFFYEGMRLEIGPCFADYSPPAFFSEATKRFAGQASIDDEGGLVGYTAGLPFSPDGISRDGAQAGDKWLWNVQQRYQGAGFQGKFRMTDLVGRIGRAEPFEGEMFKFIMSHRADRAEDDYTAPGARDKIFVAGGLFFKPFDAREHAWRQFRDEAALAAPKRSDDLHAYLPQHRRVRRINANQVEGLYMPSFSVGVVPTQQLATSSGGGGATGAGGMAAAGGVGGVGGSIQNKRSGYEGLEIRPLLYETRVVGLHDVLTPINSVSPGYPENPDRDFGPWGLSWASDRWDLRRALVLENRVRHTVSANQQENQRQVVYVDLQTLQPLYVATFDANEEMTNVGMYAFRWSEDREDYPRWPDDESRPIRVLDSIGAAYANLSEAGSWRRESWDNVATPPADRTVKRMVSVNQLTKRR